MSTSTPNKQPLTAGQFVQMVVKHEWRFRGFVATMMASTTDIDEVVQNSLLVAWEKLADFTYTEATPDEQFVRWVCTIARYQSLRLHQQRVGTALIFDDALIERLTTTQMEEAPLLESQRTALKGCVEKLAEGDKSLVRRRYSGDETVEELAVWSGKTKSLSENRTKEFCFAYSGERITFLWLHGGASCLRVCRRSFSRFRILCGSGSSRCCPSTG